MLVRVKEDYRKPELEGMLGVIKARWGGPNYVALDVCLEDGRSGRSEFFWFNQLDSVEEAAPVPFYDGSSS
jgi:hypothetical protein